MLNIAICDDDIQTTGRMDMLLQEIAKQNFIDIEIEVFWNGKSLADAVAQGTYFDMIYLDIEMDKEDGISAGELLGNKLPEHLKSGGIPPFFRVRP